MHLGALTACLHAHFWSRCACLTREVVGVGVRGNVAFAVAFAKRTGGLCACSAISWADYSYTTSENIVHCPVEEIQYSIETFHAGCRIWVQS